MLKPGTVHNNSRLLFSAAEVAEIITFVSDKVDDQIDRLEITGAWLVEARTQDGKHTFKLSEIFPK